MKGEIFLSKKSLPKDDDDGNDDVKPLEGVAIDGKTLRGSQKQGSEVSHLLSALSHRLGLTLFKHNVDEKTNEIPVCLILLENLVIKGRVFTFDALLTPRKIASTVTDNKGHYLMNVKANQAELFNDIKELFGSPDFIDLYLRCWLPCEIPPLAGSGRRGFQTSPPPLENVPLNLKWLWNLLAYKSRIK